MNEPILEQHATYIISPVATPRDGWADNRPGGLVYIEREHMQQLTQYRAWYEPIEDEL